MPNERRYRDWGIVVNPAPDSPFPFGDEFRASLGCLFSLEGVDWGAGIVHDRDIRETLFQAFQAVDHALHLLRAVSPVIGICNLICVLIHGHDFRRG